MGYVARVVYRSTELTTKSPAPCRPQGIGATFFKELNCYENIKSLLQEARRAVARNINTAMVMTYFEIGRMIVEHEQEGAKRAGYAKETSKSLSQNLAAEFGRGFSVDNLQRMRSFYLMYKKYATPSCISAKSPADHKSGTMSRISPIIFSLSWSH